MPRASEIRKKGAVPSYETIPTSEEVRICTECTLPASECNKDICKRWQEEKRKLREKGK